MFSVILNELCNCSVVLCNFCRYEGGLGLGEQQSMGVDDNYCDLYKQQRRLDPSAKEYYLNYYMLH